MRSGDEDDNRTVYCGNLSEAATDELLFELFNQAGPVESVRRPKDQSGRPKSFAFVLYKHECSVPFALEVFRGTKLFNRPLNLNSRSTLVHIPVLDTQWTEFTEHKHPLETELSSHLRNNHRSERDRERNYRREGERSRRHQSSSRERSPNGPSSWTELHALRGKGSVSNGYLRYDLRPTSVHEMESNNLPTLMPDFNALLQMGQQMMFPGIVGLPGMMPLMGPGTSQGSNMFPSMQGGFSGSEWDSPERDRRQDYNARRESRRDHPYNDRQYNDNHRRHDRGYSSSHSSHDRERRDRKSR